MRFKALLLAALTAACAPAAPAGAPLPATSPAAVPQPAELVLRGGRVFLADAGHTVVQALAVRDGRVVAAGSDAAVAPHIGSGTRVVELAGRLVTPGFNDAHIHFGAGGRSLLEVDLRGTRSLAEVEARVSAAAARAEPGEWLTGRGWDHTLLPAHELGPGGWPTRATLDRAAPRNPVYFRRVDGHVGWANSRALELAGITRATRPPPGGEIIRDAAGEATGIFTESAQALLRDRIPQPTAGMVRRGIGAALEMAAATGVTSVQTDVSPAELRVYQELLRRGELSVRVYAWHPLTMENIRAFERLGIERAFGDEWIRVGYLKGYSDGTLGSRTAYMLQPFADDPTTRGLPQYEVEQLDRLVQAADRAGLQVIIHAIGDGANRMVLDAFARSADLHGQRERRHRIEHAQILDPADIPRFAALGVIASMQPTHATSDMRWAEERIGHARAAAGAYAWRSLLDAGAHVAFGTDFAVEPMAPVEGLYSAVTRQSRDEPGSPPGGWLPDQRLTVQEAIRLYTVGSAHAEFEEHRKGTLQAGMLADLVVWDRDLLTIDPREILDARPVLTVVGGRVVFER